MLMGSGIANEQSWYQSGEGQFIGEIYWDENGDPLCYQNGTAYFAGDDGWLGWRVGRSAWETNPAWFNTTDTYLCYETPYGELHQRSYEFDLMSSFGLIGVISLVMFVVSFVGIRVFGTGLSEISVSTIVKGSLFITIWAIFSALSIGLVIQVPYSIGGIFYFFLTVLYTLGIIQQIGGN